MSSKNQTPDDWIVRLSSIGRKDRDAILQKLSHEQRDVVQQALRQRSEEGAAELDRQQQIDRQFLGYSAWLASLVEGTENGRSEELTTVAARAVWEVHSASLSTRSPIVRSGWPGLVDQMTDVFAFPPRSKS